MKKQEEKNTIQQPERKNLWQRIKSRLGEAGRRFPETFVCWVAFLVTAIVGIAIDDNMTRLSVISILLRIFGWGMLVGLNWRLLLETGLWQQRIKNNSWLRKWPKWIWGIVVTALGVGVIYLLTISSSGIVANVWTEKKSLVAWWGQISNYWQLAATLILILGVMIWPLMGRKIKSESKYVLYLGQQVVLSGLFGGLIYGGLTIAMLMLGWLFDFDWWQIQPYLAVLFLVGFEIAYFVSNFPDRRNDLTVWQVPKIWQVLLNYIALPLMLLYEVILYLYLMASALRGEWPEGGVVNFVLWFGMMMIILLQLVKVWRKQEDEKLENLVKGVALSLIPLVIVAGVGIGIRVFDQGWTMNRWLVVIGLGWILGGCILILVRKLQQKQGWLWFWSMIMILVAAGLGPVMTTVSQKSRWGEEWLTTSKEVSRGEYWREDSFDEKEENRKVDFYYSSKSDLLTSKSLRGYDLLLVSGVDGVTQNHEIETDLGKVTYYWIDGLSEEDEDLVEESDWEKVVADQARAGEFGLIINDEVVYYFDLAAYIRALNQTCEEDLVANNSASKYSYGCKAWQKTSGGGLGEEELVFTREENGITVDFYLESWSGVHDQETGEDYLDEVSGKALVKLQND